MIKEKLAFLLIAAALSTVSASCGYSTRSLLPSRIKTIHVELFKNKVGYASEDKRNLYLPLLEEHVRNAIIDRFLFDGNLKIADSEEADLILKGELLGYDRSVLRYTDNDDVQEYKINITVSLVLWDPAHEIEVWREPAFSGETTYFVIGTLAKTENEALKDALIDLARRVVSRAIEDW